MSVELVVIGASWGGLHAIGEVLAGLPADFPAPVVAVQHRRPDSEELLAALLDARGPLSVAEASDKDPLNAGCVRVAPVGYHLLVEPGHVALSVDEPLRWSRPSIDLALESAAAAYGSRLAGVVLTGANEDGAAGLAAVRARGGTAIVQDPDSAERPEMPRAAIAAARPQAVRPLAEIAPLLVDLAGAGSRAEVRS